MIVFWEQRREQEQQGPWEWPEQARRSAAALARLVVDDIEKSGVGYDRLGQAVRNLFECLALGEEGASQSLRAGENPGSLMRPK